MMFISLSSSSDENELENTAGKCNKKENSVISENRRNTPPVSRQSLFIDLKSVRKQPKMREIDVLEYNEEKKEK
ncbi:hypothetical protein CWI37_1069p0030 [Hamiltosporidium tvaerminnensis]|uniref:Uncharacterized protein n=1 Tax=Hamiltosporidium tvaerminnensis TaxID=1176355 RepID=A0A4Q9L136_9MICR|nr:hypothetical protein CWI37_1069p0030 [Hamiltosporidium tvaerminnensis]